MKFDLETFVADCRGALQGTEPQLEVRDLVSRAVSDPSAITGALGEPSGWKIQKLFNDDHLTVLHFVWPPTLELFPHEHKMWSTVGIYGGQEANTFYRKQGDRVEVTGHKTGRAKDVMLLGSDAIHSVQNNTRQWTAALHVYGGDFFANPRLQWHKETGEPEPFNIANAKSELAAAENKAHSEGII